MSETIDANGSIAQQTTLNELSLGVNGVLYEVGFFKERGVGEQRGVGLSLDYRREFSQLMDGSVGVGLQMGGSINFGKYYNLNENTGEWIRLTTGYRRFAVDAGPTFEYGNNTFKFQVGVFLGIDKMDSSNKKSMKPFAAGILLSKFPQLIGPIGVAFAVESLWAQDASHDHMDFQTLASGQVVYSF